MNDEQTGPHERMQALASEIEKHQRLYHHDDAPEIDDAAYDAMVREFRDLA